MRMESMMRVWKLERPLSEFLLRQSAEDQLPQTEFVMENTIVSEVWTSVMTKWVVAAML